ncbi:MAG: hypothetical protein ACLP36_06580 [Acidimicrobiales bacterium]
MDLELVQRLRDARMWADAAVRDRTRYVNALFRVAASDDPTKPEAVGELIVAANSLLNSLVHSVSAADRLGTLEANDRSSIVLLRNVHEHWDEQRESFVAGGPEKTRSGESIASTTKGSPWRFAYSNDPTVGISLGPLALTFIDEVVDECVSAICAAEPTPGWQPVAQPEPEPPDGLLAVVVVGQLIRNPSLGLELYQPVMTVWDPESQTRN